MTSYVPARLLGGLLCAAAFAFSAPSLAVSDEPAELSEDVNDEVEVRPPNSGDEVPRDSSSVPEERSTEAPEPAPERSSAAPAERGKPERVDREAAKRALLSDPKKEKPNPLLDARGPDYYDRRAKELLKNDSDKGRVELHPLMEAHPESHVVVCTAGCPSGQSAQIVSLLPKRNATPQPAATTTDPLEISCVGGCGNGDAASFASTPKADPAVVATVGEWMTTVAKAPIGTEAPTPKTAGSGDWMDTITRDRDAAKAAAAQQTAVNTQPAAAPSSNETKPSVSAESKPAEPAATPAIAAQTKPAEAKGTASAEAKPATSLESKPLVAEAKPATPEAAKIAAAPAAPVAPIVIAKADSKPAVPVDTPARTMDSKAQTPVPAAPDVAAQTKPVIAPAPAAPSPAPKQMAALDTPKAPVAPAAPVKPEEKTSTDAMPVTKAPAPAAADTKPADFAIKQQDDKAPGAIDDVKPSTAPSAPSPEPQKMAAVEIPKAPAAPAPVQPEAKAPAPAAVAAPKPADVKVTPPQETKVAAVEPPAVEKPAPVAPAAPKERVISVLSEDKDMNAAIGKARGSLTAFWKSYAAPAANETDHALKVAVAGNGTTEHFWLTRIKRDAGKLSGVISNQPQSVKTVKVGQRYEFTEDMISDWTFKRNGKLVGNETMRVLLPRMPEEQASVYRQMYETP